MNTSSWAKFCHSDWAATTECPQVGLLKQRTLISRGLEAGQSETTMLTERFLVRPLLLLPEVCLLSVSFCGREKEFQPLLLIL